MGVGDGGGRLGRDRGQHGRGAVEGGRPPQRTPLSRLFLRCQGGAVIHQQTNRRPRAVVAAGTGRSGLLSQACPTWLLLW